MKKSYLHKAKGRGIVTSPVIVCIKIFLISFMRWQLLCPDTKLPNRPKGQVRFQKSPRGTPPCNPRAVSTRTPKKTKAFFGGVAVSAII